MSYLDTLRDIIQRADASPVRNFAGVDPDLANEAGMSGTLARLLQAARNMDEANESAASGEWFSLRLGFSDEGPDADTVNAVLGLRPGWVVNVNGRDVVFGSFEQTDDAPTYSMYLTGWEYDPAEIEDKGAPVRVRLANAHISIL